MYKLKMGDKKLAIHNILKALETTDTFNNVAIFKKCVVLFEALRDYADEDQQQQFSTLMNKIFKEELKNEKGTFVGGNCIEFSESTLHF
ncbi:hypothetical protein [Paenibacillus caui]|uniref:hypothetical protein n=1 Tax=Paenibacillus caui TaxID=2873927 RepID=UPI001CA7BB27|nr:hypothetical protein [Paenibacillus caui]